MTTRQPIETGIPTTTREEGLAFDGRHLALRDYAADEVRAFQKPREGFIPVVEGVIEVLPRFENQLHVKGVDPVALHKKVERFQELTQAAARVEKLAEMVRETRLAVGDEIMNDLFRVYRLATAIGKDDPAIRGAFDFVREWLSTGPRQAAPVAPHATSAERTNI